MRAPRPSVRQRAFVCAWAREATSGDVVALANLDGWFYGTLSRSSTFTSRALAIRCNAATEPLLSPLSMAES